MSHLGRLEALRARQCPDTLAVLSPSDMKTSLVNKLTWANDNLQNQRWHFRETVAELDIENRNLLKGTKDLKDRYRQLQASASCLRTLVGELHREVDDARDTLKDKENKIKQLELQNKNLNEMNEQMKTEMMEMSCQISAYWDNKMYQKIDILEVRNMFENEKHLEHLQIRLELKEILYEQEKLRAHHLRNLLEELDKLRKVQRNCIVQMKGQLEELAEEAALLAVNENKSWACSSLLHKSAEPILLDDSLPLLKSQNFFCYIWNILKLLLLLTVCFGLLGYYFIINNIPLLFSSCVFDVLVQILYPYFIFKNEGLLPF